MRKELQPLEGRRITFIATFIRFGTFKTKRGIQKKVLLKNIQDTQGRKMAQHISLLDPQDVRSFIGVSHGEIIRFSAIVCSYIKGYRGNEIDLKLARPICIDYGIRDIHQMSFLSRRRYRTKEVTTSLMEEPNRYKRLSPGIC